MGLTTRIQNAWKALTEERQTWPAMTLDQWAEIISLPQGGNVIVGGFNQTLRGHEEQLDDSFVSLTQQAYKSNGIVFAVMLARMRIFRQARFRWQELRDGEPGRFFGTPGLRLLETPWPNGTTADLLSRAIQGADLSGNAFFVRRADAIRHLRPDWVTIILGSERDPDIQAGDVDAEVLGYMFHPGGKQSGRPPEFFLAESVAHFAPIPDPLASFRGMSWLTPIIREIVADKQMTDHKSAFLVNGATPNLTVAIDKDLKEAASPAAFAEWVEAFKKTNPQSGSAWEKFKTWYLAGGTTVTKVGSNMQEVDFKNVQGGGETRIAAAGGVPPIVVGLSEGLAAATYSNYGQARRAFTDNTIRDLWQDFAGSIQTIVPPPPASRLWVDDRHIPALAEDKKDQAEIHQLQSQQIRTLVDGGWEPESVKDAVVAGGDWTRLVHTGLTSVQLLPPEPEPTPKALLAKVAAPKQIPASTKGAT